MMSKWKKRTAMGIAAAALFASVATTATAANDTEPNNTRAGATPTTIGSGNTGHVSPSDLVDYFVIPNNGQYMLTLTGYEKMTMTVENSLGTVFAYKPYGTNSVSWINNTNQTLYVKVQYVVPPYPDYPANYYGFIVS